MNMYINEFECVKDVANLENMFLAFKIKLLQEHCYFGSILTVL